MVYAENVTTAGLRTKVFFAQMAIQFPQPVYFKKPEILEIV